MVGFLWGFRNVEGRAEISQRVEPGWWEVARAPPLPEQRAPTRLHSVFPCQGRPTQGLRRGETPTPPKASLEADGAGKAENRLG